MFSLIIDELNEAMSYLWEDDLEYAFHTGKAGGIAAALGARGFFLDSLCDEISAAYEQLDLAVEYDDDFDDFDAEEFEDAVDYIRRREGEFWSIIIDLKEYPNVCSLIDNVRASQIGVEEYGTALIEGIQAKSAGNELRYALMIGFVSGLMFRDPGPKYPEGSILNAIDEGYRHDRIERLQWAQQRLAAAHRLTTPIPFLGEQAYDQYMEEKLQIMRWIQNFGLHHARIGDESVAVPYSMEVNHFVRMQARHEGCP